MSLSDLPGISTADSVVLAPLPVRFTLFNAKCDTKKVLLTLKTAQEQNSHHFDIEKSGQGISWIVIGKAPAGGNSNSERSYSFTDNNPRQCDFYRIAEYDLEGKVQYTSVFRSSCSTISKFSMWPNPVHDKSFININSDNASQVIIKVFDSKGALVKMQRAAALQGNNQISVDMKSLSNGIYSLSVDWDHGRMKKTVQVFKQ